MFRLLKSSITFKLIPISGRKSFKMCLPQLLITTSSPGTWDRGGASRDYFLNLSVEARIEKEGRFKRRWAWVEVRGLGRDETKGKEKKKHKKKKKNGASSYNEFRRYSVCVCITRPCTGRVIQKNNKDFPLPFFI